MWRWGTLCSLCSGYSVSTSVTFYVMFSISISVVVVYTWPLLLIYVKYITQLVTFALVFAHIPGQCMYSIWSALCGKKSIIVPVAKNCVLLIIMTLNLWPWLRLSWKALRNTCCLCLRQRSTLHLIHTSLLTGRGEQARAHIRFKGCLSPCPFYLLL